MRIDSGLASEDFPKLFDMVASSGARQFVFTRDIVICLKCGAMGYDLARSCRVCRSKNIRIWSRGPGNYQDVRSFNGGQLQELRDSVRYGCTGEAFKLTAGELRCLK